MSATTPNLRDTLNAPLPGRLPSALQAINFADVLALLVRALSATEAGVVPASNKITLANVPSVVLQVNVTAGTTTGIKDLLIGPSTLVPATGQCVWVPGTKTIIFAAADAATAVSVTYAIGNEKLSILTRTIGETDSP